MGDAAAAQLHCSEHLTILLDCRCFFETVQLCVLDLASHEQPLLHWHLAELIVLEDGLGLRVNPRLKVEVLDRTLPLVKVHERALVGD